MTLDSHPVERAIAPIAASAVVRFCDAIGDLHPIHRDAKLAAEFGFERPVVPGTLLATILLAEIASRSGDVARVAIRFKSWVYTQEALSVHWTDSRRLRLLGSDGRLCAVARVSERRGGDDEG